MRKLKIVCYSINIGGYDSEKQPPELKSEDYIYVSENAPDQQIWKHHPLPEFELTTDYKRLAGQYKTNPTTRFLPDHDVSIYVDASLKFTSSIWPLIVDFIQSDRLISIPFHPRRLCTYKEAEVCIEKKIDDPKIIADQMERYRSVGFPEDYGLVATPLILRRNTAEVQAFNLKWSTEILKESKRDQLSVMFASWAQSLPIHQMNLNINNNPYFIKCKHLKLRNQKSEAKKPRMKLIEWFRYFNG